MATRKGWHGWDEYAPFYDWENRRTIGRQDVAFWRRVAGSASGLVLELGCGTGRVTLPLARSGIPLVGVDRSPAMLRRATKRLTTLRRSIERRTRGPVVSFVRGDITALPFRDGKFGMVLAPYGVLQSLLAARDLTAALASARRVLRRGGTLGIDLVPDVPKWREYENRVQMQGRASGGRHLTLVESVRQNRKRALTTFEQRYLERRGRRVEETVFRITFRTLPVRRMIAQLRRVGFEVNAVLGDYRGGPWDERAEVWILLATRT
jgi:ubiquinone/menaquinone biosynthesis C-methylase UbiE